MEEKLENMDLESLIDLIKKCDDLLSDKHKNELLILGWCEKADQLMRDIEWSQKTVLPNQSLPINQELLSDSIPIIEVLYETIDDSQEYDGDNKITSNYNACLLAVKGPISASDLEELEAAIELQDYNFGSGYYQFFCDKISKEFGEYWELSLYNFIPFKNQKNA
jgi:hypothetical protein